MRASFSSAEPQSPIRGVGRVLVACYGILALAALGRSVFQIITKFDSAPLAYVLSAVAAAVYVLITVLLLVDRPWARVTTWIAISIELVGVLVAAKVLLLLLPPDGRLGRG